MPFLCQHIDVVGKIPTPRVSRSGCPVEPGIGGDPAAELMVVIEAGTVVALTQQYQVFAFLETIGSGAASAAAASVVSQGVGVAAGIQDKFSFKGVAMATVSAGIGGGGMVAILWKLYKAASQQTVPKLTVSAALPVVLVLRRRRSRRRGAPARRASRKRRGGDRSCTGDCGQSCR